MSNSPEPQDGGQQEDELVPDGDMAPGVSDGAHDLSEESMIEEGEGTPVLTFALPPGIDLPIDRDELASSMIAHIAEKRGLMLLEPQRLQEIAQEMGSGIASMYMQGLDEEAQSMYSINIDAAGMAPDGRLSIFLSIEDLETGNFVLPTTIPEMESEELEDALPAYSLEGGSSLYQGIMLTVRSSESVSDAEGEGERKVGFVVDLVMPPILTVSELSRLAECDFRSPFSDAMQRQLEVYGDRAQEIAIMRVATDGRYSDSFMRYLFTTDQGTYLHGMGDIDDSGVVSTYFFFRFDEPAVGELQNGNGEPSSGEGIVSSVRQLSKATGELLLTTDESQESYWIPQIQQLIETHLFDRAVGVWEEDFEVKFFAPRVTPDGKVRLIATVEDKDGNFVLPWLGDSEVTKSVRSNGLTGIAAQVQLPEEMLPRSPGAPKIDPEKIGDVEIAQHLPHAYIPSSLMDMQIRQLSHRKVTKTPESEGGEIISSAPSELAKESIFYNELERVILEDLMITNRITPAQAGAINLKNIRVASDKQVDVGMAFDRDYYFVVAEHELGAHVVTFQRFDRVGYVPFNGSASVYGFFPIDQYKLRHDVSELALE